MIRLHGSTETQGSTVDPTSPRKWVRLLTGRRRAGGAARATVALALTAVAVFATVTVADAPAQAVPPPTPNFGGAAVEGYAPQPPFECLHKDPHRPGVEKTMAMLIKAYPNSREGGTWANCVGHTSTSDHYSGRALDWHPGRPFVEPTASARADGYEVVRWLLATVNGVPNLRARRLGIVYIIWDNRIWIDRIRVWQQYQDCTGTQGNPTTCHRDHVHLTFGTAGAEGRTSWWRGGPNTGGG